MYPPTPNGTPNGTPDARDGLNGHAALNGHQISNGQPDLNGHIQRDAGDRHTERGDGFRLRRLEVYNWGTFNQHIWTVEPDGGTALLTGANGSGKSTLVDALLTLLVPHARRGYNQASGVEKRRERDERSYVRGAYGRIRDGESNTGINQFLRDKDVYSVLLAVFADTRTREPVTLAQVFWTQDDGIKKFYVVARSELSIAQHFSTSGTMAELRGRLRAAEIGVYDEFVKYSATFRRIFGLRSEKALDLFNQIVSIKEIGGLNEFVRAHMLERSDAQDKIAQLRENYENLTHAHDAIQRAERLLAQLRPLVEEAAHYDQLRGRIDEAERCAAAVGGYFAARKIALLDRAAADARTEITRQRDASDERQRQLDALRQRQIDLNVAISNDAAGQRLQQLRQEIQRVAERRQERHTRAAKYDALAARLDLPTLGNVAADEAADEAVDGAADEAAFYATGARTREEVEAATTRHDALLAERDARTREAAGLEATCRELRDEVESLRARQSQIPAEDLALRARLAAALKIPEGELPFIGELLKVKEDARPWEGAIERLLHAYGRQLLVPDTHYRRVSAYVDATNLRGRLVYHRVAARRGAPFGAGLDGDSLPHKLEIKPDTPFHDWLRADLIEHFAYTCCATLEQFQREVRALTMSGQIKRGVALHEKDDRYPIGDRKRYVLGWDNRDKLAALETELAHQAEALRAVVAAVGALDQERRRLDERQRLLGDLLRFDEFAALHYQADDRLLEELEAQRRELEASSDRLRALRAQLDGVTGQIGGAERGLAGLHARIGALETEVRRYERQRRGCETILEGAAGAAGMGDMGSHAARIEADLKDTPVTLDTVDELQTQTERAYTQSAAALKGRLGQVREAILVLMTNFKRDYLAETQDTDAAIEAIGEFRRMLERIEREDLPRHARRFKELLDEKVISNIAIFKGALEKQVDEIKASIASLNSSLRGIDYTPSTYIQLCHDASRDREIQEFRHTLRDCLPDVARARTPEANEASFERIRALIQRFEKEERWTAKVTDVRNWLEFSAEECYQEDDTVKHFYSDSAGKSGGQKAKLAYTILASAIAYQYGLDKDTRPDASKSRSFRFVVVDEAFSKSDETNARYAMELFKRLNLQLLVVTPLDKTHVVEPYIAACHFVANTPEENDSRVYNLTIQQYEERKLAAQVEMARR